MADGLPTQLTKKGVPVQFLFSSRSLPVQFCSTSRASMLPVRAAANRVSTAYLRSHLRRTNAL